MPTPAKPDDGAPVAVETANLPTVSVQEAMGLPEPQSFVQELKNLEHAPEIKPAGADEPVTPPVAPAKPAEVAPAKPAPVAPAKPAKPAPAAKPAEGTPAKVAPAAPAAPAAEPPKIKVGGKEYTQEELEAELKRSREPAPAAPVAPPVRKEPTPEERAQSEAQQRKAEGDWTSQTSKLLEAPIDEASLDKILAGGPEAVRAFQELRQRDMAAAVLFARKSIYAELNPILEQIQTAQVPLSEFVSAAETERAVSEFNTSFPHLADRTLVVDSCAKALLDSRPQDVARMTRQDFFKEVAAMAEQFIQRVQPPSTKIKLGDKEYTTDELQAIVSAQAAPAAGEPPVVPAAPAAPVKTNKGGPRPLGANSPGMGASGKGPKSSVASLLPD